MRCFCAQLDVVVRSGHATKFPPTKENIERIRRLAQAAGVVGIGEIGLDFSYVEGGSRHRESSEAAGSASTAPTKADQIAWLVAQWNIAVELQLPVLLHERDAHDAFVQQLTPLRGALRRPAVLNCFNGTAAALTAYTRALDLYVVITGLVCNDQRGLELRHALGNVADASRLLVGRSLLSRVASCCVAV